jgi:AMMECR1 domain-containing protein
MHGGQSGCFLPEVATDQGWGVEEFLSYCCAHKAGLPADAWKQPGTDVYLFTSEKFSE